MPRPVERGRAGVWSLVQVASEAGVTRGVARAAVARGYIPDTTYTTTDIVMLRVAAACLAYPDPAEPLPPKHSPAAGRPGRRDDLVLRFARAILGDSRADAGACVLFAGSHVEPCDQGVDLPRVMARFETDPVVVLPIGRWRLRLPSDSHQEAAERPQGPVDTSLTVTVLPDTRSAVAAGSARPVVPGEPW